MVMATGGLGGVHRDASATFDISTDLDELARADGAVVVCSGLKSILDVPASLEALETRGVLVAGYGTDVLPGFLAHSSGLPLEHRVDTPAGAAAVIRAHRALRLPGAIVLAQPVPSNTRLIPVSFRPRSIERSQKRPPGELPGNRSRRSCSNQSGSRPQGAGCGQTAPFSSPMADSRPRLPPHSSMPLSHDQFGAVAARCAGRGGAGSRAVAGALACGSHLPK